MRILTGICVSACLTLALTGCAKKSSIEACPAPAADCPPAQTAAAAPARAAKPETAARLIPATPIDQTPARPEADEEQYEDKYARARNRGEGTADWAVPLEDMPGYPESTGAAEPAAEERTSEAPPVPMASARTESPAPADALDGAFGADENGGPAPATVSVPDTAAAAEIDFPDEPAAPGDFGLKPEERIEPPEQIAQSEPAIEPAAEIAAEPVSEAEDDLFDFDALGLSLDPLPAEEPTAEPEEEAPEEKTMAAAKPETETEPETVDPLLPTEDDLDFFGSLSDSFFNEQSDGKSGLEG